MKIGVIGGTFDPIHNGHLLIGEVVREQQELVVVLFVPNGRPWLKTKPPIASAAHRAEMVCLAIAGKPYFKLSTVDIDRPGPSYSVDTLADLQAQLGSQNEFFFILGWDSFAELPQWQTPSRLVGLCRLVVVPRPGCPRPALNALEALIPGLSERVTLMDRPEIDISASEIRRRVAHGLSISHLVPEAVNTYIRQHKLYNL